MGYNLIKEADIKGLGVVNYVEAPFDEAVSLIGSNNVISARDLAYARMKAGYQSSLCENGSYIKEEVLYVPKQDVTTFFVRDFFVLKNAKKATNAHRDGKECFVNEKISGIVEKSKARSNQVVAVKNYDPIPTDRFEEEEIPVFLFADLAKDYGLFLKDFGIDKMPLVLKSSDYINMQGEPYAHQLWLAWFDYNSRVSGSYWDIGNLSRVRGVQRDTTKGGRAQKLPYNNRAVDKALKIVTGVKEGNFPTSKLERVVDFLTKIRKD